MAPEHQSTTAPTAKAAPGSAAPVKSTANSIRETLESIVVAFTLAFIFRAFIVEAFVIPTGSMAATLYGEQITHTCSTCGFEYAHGVEQGMTASMLKLKCPNCGAEADEVPGQQLIQPASGDRILVHKWPFNLGKFRLGPNRWEVTVFKDPHNGTVNFIKRLVGLPGEVLEIIHGDVYTAKLARIEAADPTLIRDFKQLRLDLYRHAAGQIYLPLPEVAQRYASINQRLAPLLSIQRKAVDAPVSQTSLWFNVFNQDFLPNYEHANAPPAQRVGWSTLLFSPEILRPEELNDGRVPSELRTAFKYGGVELTDSAVVTTVEPGRQWEIADLHSVYLVVREESSFGVYDASAAKAWSTSTRVIRFDSPATEPLFIHFGGKPVDDFYAYNFFPDYRQMAQARVPVGDLRLAFTWFPDAGQGGLVLQMNRHKDTFVARIGVNGTVSLERLNPDLPKGGRLEIGKKAIDPLGAGQAVEVEFTNVDFRAALKINGQEVLATTDEQYHPNLADLLSRDGEDPNQTEPSTVRVGAYNLRCRLAHMALERDVYYRSGRFLETASPGPQPGQPAPYYPQRRNPFLSWPGWATQGWPIMLREKPFGEYFMMGDNSPGSKDSRLWWEAGPHLEHLGEQYCLGTVPEDQLVGQAFFVYWPAGYRRSWTANIGIIPNFGRLRWIR